MAKVVYTAGDDISTDVIYPGRYLATVLPSETPQYAFADDLDFNQQLTGGEIPPGSVLVAGVNFGCGSSREQAASCLVGWGLTVIAHSFARIFLQNAVNLGLDLVTVPEFAASVSDELEFAGETVINRTIGLAYPVVVLPQSRQAIVDAGGLVAYTRQRMLEAD